MYSQKSHKQAPEIVHHGLYGLFEYFMLIILLHLLRQKVKTSEIISSKRQEK